MADMVPSETASYIVSLMHSRFAGPVRAELRFGGGHACVANLQEAIGDAKDGQTFSHVTAAADTGETFSLWSCRLIDNRLQVDVITGSELTQDRLTEIEVRCGDIQNWFWPDRRIPDRNGRVKRGLRRPLFKHVPLKDGKQEWNLSHRYEIESGPLQGPPSITEHAVFTFESATAELRIQDVHDKVWPLACLLTLLSGETVTIARLRVRGHSGELTWAYFPTVTPDEGKPSAFPWHVSLPLRLLARRWKKIVPRFFESDLCAPFWVRLAGMRRYTGYWDFLVFGFVSLLDRYVVARANTSAVRKPADPNKLQALQRDLAQVNPVLKPRQVQKIVRLVATRYAPTKQPTFEARRDDVMRRVPQEIHRALALSDEQLAYIKTIRDAIGHSDEVTLSSARELDIEMLVAKIDLLLTYFTFRELGFAPEDFLRALARPKSTVARQRAQVDDRELTRSTAPDHILAVSEANLRALRVSLTGIHRFFPTLVRFASGNLVYSTRLSARLRAHRVPGPTTLGQLFGVPEHAVRALGHGFVECGSEFLELTSNLYIFEQDRLPTGFDIS